MNTARLVAGIAGVLALFVCLPRGADAAGRVVPDSYIVTVAADAWPADVAERHGVMRAFEYSDVVRGFAAFIPPQALEHVLADVEVEMVIEDREIEAIGKPSGGGTAPAQVVPAGVQRIGALGQYYTGDGVGVAVVDTGIDLASTDLAVGGISYSAVSASAKDDNGHGTHVAGIIAARDNTIGVVGVAPRATVYAVKVLNRSGSGTDSSVLAGLDWVARNAAAASPAIRVVNMSLGRPGSLDDNPAYRQAVQALVQLGVAVVVAAGNDSSKEVSQMVPATYPEVMAVASTTAKAGKSAYAGFAGIGADTASYFTTDGAMLPLPDGVGGIGVTISAPGEDQEDVSKTGAISSVGILSLKPGGGTARMSGTSMAAPHVAGVAAILVQQAGGALAPADVRRRIMAGASNTAAPYASPTAGYTFDGDLEGIVDVVGALNVQ